MQRSKQSNSFTKFDHSQNPANGNNMKQFNPFQFIIDIKNNIFFRSFLFTLILITLGLFLSHSIIKIIHQPKSSYFISYCMWTWIIMFIILMFIDTVFLGPKKTTLILPSLPSLPSF